MILSMYAFNILKADADSCGGAITEWNVLGVHEQELACLCGRLGIVKC